MAYFSGGVGFQSCGISETSWIWSTADNACRTSRFLRLHIIVLEPAAKREAGAHEMNEHEVAVAVVK